MYPSLPSRRPPAAPHEQTLPFPPRFLASSHTTPRAHCLQLQGSLLKVRQKIRCLCLYWLTAPNSPLFVAAASLVCPMLCACMP